MASSSALPFVFFIAACVAAAAAAAAAVVVEAQVDDSSLQMMTDAMEWASAASVSYSYPFGGEEEDDGEEVFGGDPAADAAGGTRKSMRRSLFWHRIHQYYISYGALSANRIPCPPRSGRSYYTHNCYRARGPVHPYTRGCSAITRCRR